MSGVAGFISTIKLAIDLANAFLSMAGVNLSLHDTRIIGGDNTIDIVFVLRLSCSDKAVCEALMNTLKNPPKAPEEESELEEPVEDI